MTDAPAEALGFDARGSILGLTRDGRARGVKSVRNRGARRPGISAGRHHREFPLARS